MCLNGTVPISFNGAKYNIPMIIWVPKTYPYQSPTCFVTPTKGMWNENSFYSCLYNEISVLYLYIDMVIKQNHRSVDPNGQCYAPYIQDWSTSSNLVGG